MSGGGFGLPASSPALEKYEAQIDFASAITITVSEDSGARSAAVVVVPAAWSGFLASATSLLSQIATALTADGTLIGTYSASVDDNTDVSFGKATISATGIGNFTITWDAGGILRDILGFTGATSVSSSIAVIGANHAQYLWLPNCGRNGQLGAYGTVGVPVGDGTLTVSPSGTVAALAYNTRYVDTIQLVTLKGYKALVGHERYVNESLESFWLKGPAKGKPVRYLKDRSDDATYVTHVWLNINALNVTANDPTWNEANALYSFRADVVKSV